jgi:hypothetical protein
MSASLRFVGVVIGFSGLGAVLSEGAQRRYDQLTNTLIEVPYLGTDEKLVVSR